MPTKRKRTDASAAASSGDAERTTTGRSADGTARDGSGRSGSGAATREGGEDSARTAKSTTAASKKGAGRKQTSKRTAKQTAKQSTKQSAKQSGKKQAAGKQAAKATGKQTAKKSRSGSGAASAENKSGGSTTDRFLAGQRKLLEDERATYLRQAENFQAEADALAADREPGDIQFDEEGTGEGDTINFERERDLAMSAQARAAVEDIERALAKIDAGTYGTCEQCGDKIPRERLKAIPQAALCVRCKSGGLSRR